MMSYDRRPVERRKLASHNAPHHFVYWIYALIVVAFLLSLLK
jgi:hypothetical protein